MERLIDGAPAGLNGAAALLADVVLPQVDRARALIDDNPSSRTYGCADRGYWYYRTLTNFPGSTWQQLMLAFAALYRTRHPANPHYLASRTSEVVEALLMFWAKAQHRDGAFDEWYLNERSYCPTAITSAGAAMTLSLMGDALSGETRAVALAALERAGAWLVPRYNTEVMNQNLAAAAVLQGLAHLLPGSRWESVAAAKLERIRRDQTSEGWFPEYAGMDFGYSTLALDLLAACSVLGARASVAELAQCLIRFLLQVRGAGFSTPGRLGSRGTSHCFVFGALYFAADDGGAAAVGERLLGGIARQLVPRPATVDDRYFAYFYMPQFALAFQHAASAASTIAPVTSADRVTDLQGCGLAIVRRDGWSVTVSRRLGGAVAVERIDSPPLYHLGYEVANVAQERYSSAVWNPLAESQRVADGQVVEVTALFRAISSGLPLRRLMIPFQLIIHTLLSSRLAAAFQSMVKRRMIAPKKSPPLKLERRIEAGTNGVRIRDTLLLLSKTWRVASVSPATTISMHSPSGRQDLAEEPQYGQLLRQASELLNRDGRAVLHWSWQSGVAQPTIRVEAANPATGSEAGSA